MGAQVSEWTKYLYNLLVWLRTKSLCYNFQYRDHLNLSYSGILLRQVVEKCRNNIFYVDAVSKMSLDNFS